MLDDEKRKIVTAQMILARLVIMGAPNEVTQPMRQWCEQLEKGKETAFSENVAVSDFAQMEMVNVPHKEEN